MFIAIFVSSSSVSVLHIYLDVYYFWITKKHVVRFVFLV